MSFIRPEVRAALWRWRDALAGGVLTLWGAWLGLAGYGFNAILGAAVSVLGIALVFAGWQRARFRRDGSGPGVVEVTEGQIAFFGPVQGGILPVEAISVVVLDPAPASGPVWELRSPGTGDLMIPVDAAGSEALFDVFATLPGFDTEAMLTALEHPGEAPQVIWTRPHARLH